MKHIMQVLLFALPLVLSAPALAQQSFPPDNVAIGAVESVYVKVAHGVYMEVRLSRVKNPAETWSDVRMRQTAAGKGKPRNELAKNPEGMTVNKGDIVQLTMGVAQELAAGPLPEITQVTERVAPAGSALARQFEQQQQQQFAPAMTLAEQFRM